MITDVSSRSIRKMNWSTIADRKEHFRRKLVPKKYEKYHSRSQFPVVISHYHFFYLLIFFN